jgi:ribosomal peptide maturation radical SAM protein 1
VSTSIAPPTVAWPVTGDVERLSGAQRGLRSGFGVALVSMPLAEANRPSIQLGLLKALADSHGFAASTHALFLDFMAFVGAGDYGLLSGRSLLGIGDWLFSREAYGERAPDPESRLFAEQPDLAAWLRRIGPSLTAERMVEIRTEVVPAYLDHLMETAWGDQRVVGFSTNFEQNTASIALARRIKDRFPSTLVVFGGANCDGLMGEELLASSDAIDFVVSGEADTSFTRLLVHLTEGRGTPSSIPGLRMHGGGDGPAVVSGPANAPLRRMDDLPTPDYTEYFERARRLGILDEVTATDVFLPVETSRGCWWGAKRQCTFCGLNGSTMEYRSKSPERVVAELAELNERYGTLRFNAVDNILDESYFDTVLPVLADIPKDYVFFYEIKASASREQVRRLSAAGVRAVQPGIESLNSHVLGLMRKGTRASTNVNLMRWALHHGIDIAWNLLYGFPGETDADYDEQADLLPLLVHLQPPGSAARIVLERFSPMFDDTEAFPRRWAKPMAAYPYVYPRDVDLDRIGYFFEYEMEVSLPPGSYDRLHKEVGGWRDAWSSGPRPQLTMWQFPGIVRIEDRRRPDRPSTHTLTGSSAALYSATSDKAASALTAGRLAGDGRPGPEIERQLDQLVRSGLMMRDGNLFLALAVPAGRGRPMTSGVGDRDVDA